MKVLYIIRHGKSSWEFNIPDDERPLMQKGIKRTRKIAKFLKEKDITADLMISSYAVRAFATAKIIAEFLDYPEDEIQISSNLYHATSDSIFGELLGLDDSVNNAMIFGHNPTFTSFANQFLDEMIDWLPTTAVVAIRFHTDKWSELPLAKHETAFTVFPRDL